MDLSNLIVGNVYKNYKELCSALNEKVKTGNSKLSQLNEWERYFSYEKKGHKFIINEIYSEPLPATNTIGNNAAPYIDDIVKLILDLLVQDNNKGKLFLSINALLKQLNMVNDNYTYCKGQTLKLSKVMNVPHENIEDFYQSSNTTLKSNLETALNSLKRQALIHWYPSLTVCFIDTYIETNELGEIKINKHEYVNEKGETITNFQVAEPVKKRVYREATEQEERIILRIERELLEEYNCQSKADLFKRGKVEEYYKKVKDRLFEKTNILFYYNSYKIIFNEDQVKEQWNKLEEQYKLNILTKDITQTMLNAGIMDRLIDKATKRYEKAVEELSITFCPEEESKKTQMRASNDYILNNDKLTEMLINRETKSIKVEMEEVK